MYQKLLQHWHTHPLRYGIAGCGVLSALSLVMAYVAEYGFRLLPCELCLLQRKPFFAVIVLAALAMWLQRITAGRMILGLIAALLLGNSGLAFYHTGVEQKWWQGPTECSNGDMQAGLSIEAMRAQIMAAPLVRCDTPAWEFHGITMASLNIVFCLFLSVFAWSSLYFSLNGATAPNPTLRASPRSVKEQ